MRLFEVRIINSVHPTDNQKRVLAKILAAPTPTVAAEQISDNANMVSARDMMVKLGLVTVEGGEATLTDQGMQVATDEHIIDETGQLTKQGQGYAYSSAANGNDADVAGNVNQDDQPIGPPLDPGQTGSTPTDGLNGEMAPMESMSLLKQLLR